MRATRLVSLLLLLQMRGQLTAQELADHFEVSVRTIHRDVESLGAAGVPVEAVRGPAGGYRLAGGYRTKLTGLTAAEAEALFVAPAPAAELGLGGVLANARLKVLAALPAELQERASRAERYFHLDARGWFRGEDTVPHLPTIAVGDVARAATERALPRGRARRPPHARSARARAQRQERGTSSHIARRGCASIASRASCPCASATTASNVRRTSSSARYWEEWSRTFEASRPRVEVKLRASELALRHLPRDLQGGDGVFTVGFESLEEAFRELLKFGPDAEVLEPAELRDAHRRRRRARSRELYAVHAVR